MVFNPKAFHFRSDEKNIHVLESAKIDVASIANNHVLDYEYEALDHMIRIFDAHGILHVGAGKNFSEASKPVICKVENQKLRSLPLRITNLNGLRKMINRASFIYQQK